MRELAVTSGLCQLPPIEGMIAIVRVALIPRFWRHTYRRS
jgi:hypothetical protein